MRLCCTQSSADPLLAIEALLCGMMASSILKKIALSRFMIHLYNILLMFGDAMYAGFATCRGLVQTDEHKHRVSRTQDSLPAEDSYGKYSSQRPKFPFTSPRTTKKRASHLSDSDAFYSTFHKTPERKQVSKEEWEKFTKESTKKALEGLVSSPDFSKWAVAHADRITLRPKSQDDHERPRRWLPWF